MRRAHRRLHLLTWLALALLLPGVFAAALSLRLSAPPEEAPQRLAPP